MTGAGTVAAPAQRAAVRPGVIVRVVRLLGGAIFVASLGLGAYAGFQWLQSGATGGALVADLVVPEMPAGARAWLREPDSWFGLHRFAVWVVRMPVFAASGFVGFLLLLATGKGRRG
jgi:hypothetical protein